MKKSKARVLITTPTFGPIVNEIENIRADNNGLWMDILRLALKSAPKETKQTIAWINRNDKKISRLLGKLAK